MVTFAPGYPKVRRVRRQIDELEQALQVEQERIFSGVSESFQLAVQRERLLEDEVVRQRGLVNRLSDDFIAYDILKRDAETNRQLYEGLLQRLKEAGISAGLRASNIAVLDVAEAPDEPYRPKKLYNLSMALLAGLALGVALGFVQEHMDTVVRTPEEVEGLTGLSLLAVVPRSRRKDAPKVATTEPRAGSRCSPNDRGPAPQWNADPVPRCRARPSRAVEPRPRTFRGLSRAPNIRPARVGRDHAAHAGNELAAARRQDNSQPQSRL